MSGKNAGKQPPPTRTDRKISKLEQTQGQYDDSLDKARAKLPSKTVIKSKRVFNVTKGKAETKLSFEKEVIPIGDAKWNVAKKKPLPLKAVGALKTAGVNKLHSKIYEVEQENVGTQVAHRVELLGESAYRGLKKVTRSAYRFHKNRPYRRASKLETLSLKNEMKLSYQKALRDNPKLKSNPISRLFQKRSIKQKYAAALRNAKNAGKTANRAAGVVSRVASVVNNVVRRNPVFMLTAAGLLLLICAIMSLFTMCSSVFSGNTAAVGALTYAAADADIDNAELKYTEWETDLQIQIANAETTHSGYDEYRYNCADIGHNPLELMAHMTAKYADFTFAEAETALRSLFDSQYSLSFVPVTETRTRTETRTNTSTDPETGATTTTEYEVEVEYDWHILNINLTANSFTGVVSPLMSADERQHYEMLMKSKGARQYVSNPFEFNWLPYVTSNYGYRVHPISGEKNYHKGIDIGLAAGTEIHAGFDGTVIQTGYDASGFGNFVVVEDKDGVQAKYAHCDTVSVSTGQTVLKGDVIATVGNTGNSTGAHLHLEVVKAGQYLNPIYFCETGDDGSGSIPPGSPGGVIFPLDPGAAMGDGSYTALILEAERHLGKPYVFGAKGPDAFDCSGFVCAALTNSGVRSIATNAQGIFNASTPVSPENAMPGDLVFFHSTYSTHNTVTHVAIYCGGTTMLHAGNPIQYTSFDTHYWREHFYSFARM